MEGDTTKKNADPPETDLDYYSRPENYEGSNLTNIKRFNFAKQKEDKAKLDALKSKKKKKDGFDLFKRYRHILKGYLDADIEPDEPDTSDDEGEESSSKKIKFIAEEDSKSEKSDIEKPKTSESIKKEEKLDVKLESFDSCEIPINTPDTPTDSGYRTGTGTIGKERSLSVTPADISGSQSCISGRKSASGRSSVSLKGNLLSRELRARQAKENWRKYTRFIIMVHKLSSAAGQGDTDMGMKTFTDIASEAESSTLKSSGLSFDPNYFKAKKEINISNEVKNILSLPSEQRSPEQIQTAMFGLQSLRSFAEYPLHMQEKLASVAWFELVPPKRIIIRQGHFAENFYFILSGQAVVTLLLKDPKTGASFVKTATIMRKGMSFGELALLHHSRRTATVTSQGTVQLLTIGRADFFDIFMSGAGPDDIPEHIKFISQCDFMKDWPIENLLEHPEKCLLHFFKRNVVIVKDSTFNEWIYVVKSGFCQVLKQLKGVTPRLGFNTRQNADKDPSIPKLPGLIKEAKVDTGLRRKRRSKSAPVKEENEENSPPMEEHKAPEAHTFSKDQYSKNPTTLKAHFAVKRPKQNYVIPEKCRPPKPVPEPKELSTGKLPAVYVQVEALKPRDAFGLETIEFDTDSERTSTVVSLVSRGAECIMLSKEFFMKHANEKVKKLIRHQVQPYPEDEAFQNNLQIKSDWQFDTDMGMKTFTDIASEAESSTLKSSGLSFDPNYFKAKKEINISNEVKNILSLPSEQRSPEQIQTAMFGLQSLRSFAEYPLHMQEKLASVAWFELVPPKRIIIRQGHFAENFYFILSGQAVVTLLLKDPKTGASFVKTATIMSKGMSFGELALLHHSRRTATVTSQGTVQLLTIGRADFFDIFMSGAGPDDIPEHIKFISQCDFMKDWPIENLLEHPEKCLLHFFKRNVVIVKDSTFNEWIYVVKSGFCQVLKQLKGVTPRLGFNARQNADKDPSIPKLPGLIKEAKVDTGLRRKRRSKSAPVKEENEENSPPMEEHKAPEAHSFSKDQYSKNPTTLKAHFAVKRPKQNYVIPEKCRPPKPVPEPKELSTGKLPAVYVQVEALKPRDAFGLETIEFDTDSERTSTVVSLVSRGAECIMLSKEFFMKHANEKVKKLIRHQVQPYPEDEAFQNNLQIKSDWQLYRHSLITTLTSNL